MALERLEASIAKCPWYVIYTIPKNEKKVYHELIRRNIPTFLPMQKVVRQWSDRKKKIETPLFPNYIFVKIPSNQLWSALSITGTVRFISFAGVPAIIRESEIETIKKLIFSDEEIKNETAFIEGQKVRVMQGPFSGLEGKVSNIKGKTRLFVELKTINQVLSVDISAYLLERLDNISSYT